jgi:hypothetical protein
MSSIDERFSEQFYQWEQRGRGWQVFAEPVTPEPPFRPFNSFFQPAAPIVDDGRRPTLLSSLADRMKELTGAKPATVTETPSVEEAREPEPFIREPLIELQAILPAKLNLRREDFEEFLLAMSLCNEPITFEVLGLSSHVSIQFAVHPSDEKLVHQRLRAFFPEASFLPRQNTLIQAWQNQSDAYAGVIEFGLAKPFMFPLATRRIDLFTGIIGALSELAPDELGLFQVIFQPVRAPWADNIIYAVTDNQGDAFFANALELTAAAKEKVSSPLYAAVVRLAAQASTPDRVWELARHIAGALSIFAVPNGNELIPLRNDEYLFDLHIEDVLRRQSRRPGMLLNSTELVGFVHLPSADVRSPKLERHTTKTKRAPQAVCNQSGLRLGGNVHSGETVPVVLSPEQRVRHMHVIGASGTGKSTLLFNLIRQDIENGEGVAVLDPHGDLVDQLLGIIPEKRIDDVVLLDPSDEEYAIGFNILSAHSELEKNLLASDLVSVFQRLSSSWGDQMASVLNNAILAFLESSRGGTLADLRRFLLEPEFRKSFLETVRDPEVVYYWRKVFSQLAGNKSIGPVLTRLEIFLSRKPIRYMVSQSVNRLDFTDILDTGKIFLAKLPQGIVGRENSYLLGTLLVSKFQQIAMARQKQSVASRRDFWLYIDEFHNFITPSMAEILSGARKYRLGLTLAHQELRQLQRDSEVGSAVLSNAGTRICFRVGDDDAKKLAEGFSTFEAQDLRNLDTGQAVCRVERSDYDFNLAVPMPEPMDEAITETRRRNVIRASRAKYAKPCVEIENTIRESVSVEQSSRDRELTASAKPTISEKQKVAVSSAGTEPSVSTPDASPVPTTDLGRGGAQHQAIQQRLKRSAEALGFRAIIERQILDGQGSIDLLLERADLVLACEISITTTIDHEVGNVSKCIKAGFQQVVVICSDESRLQRIATAVMSSLGPDVAKRIMYFLPDQFIAHLRTLPVSIPALPAEPKVRRGYKVTTKHVQLPLQELKAREDAAITAIAESMKKHNRRGV